MTNEVYRGRERSTTPRRNYSKNTGKSNKYLKLFFKQAIAAAVCIAVVYLMHNSDVPFLTNCTDALSRAIRYETDFSGIAQTVGDTVTGWFGIEN